jgi:cytochrome b involved in lipid metabolism
VTADNWKDTIRFHFVQYQHIYEQALDGFYAAVLSRKLLLAEFSEELKKLEF